MFRTVKVILLVILFIEVAVGNNTSLGFTRQFVMIKNVIFDHRITNTKMLQKFEEISSITECGDKCVSSTACLSFFYNVRKKTCQTHGSIFYQRDSTFHFNPGYVYNQVSKEGCNALIDKDFTSEDCLRYEPGDFFESDNFENVTPWEKEVSTSHKRTSRTTAEELSTPKATTNTFLSSSLVTIKQPEKSFTTSSYVSTSDKASTKPGTRGVTESRLLTTATTTVKQTTTATTPSTPGLICKWYGTAPFCIGICPSDWDPVRTSSSGGGRKCWTGQKTYCCKAEVSMKTTKLPGTPKDTDQPPMSCQWFGRSPFCQATCPSGWKLQRYSKSGNGANCWTGKKSFCCMDGENCELVGMGPFCESSRHTCYSRAKDFSRLASDGCWTGKKALCCDFKRRLGCNGLVGLCDLTFDQVTLAGSHNSGSGSNGLLKYSSGLPAISCFYRNQLLTFTQQLISGIRYFDIDVCWKDNRAFNCHRNAYGVPLKQTLEEIRVWMSNEDNHNEVVAMRFHDYNNLPGHRGADVIKDIAETFSGQNRRPGLNDVKPTSNSWPTLREAIDNNKRVFVFLHSHICNYRCQQENRWVHPGYYYQDTWTSFSVATTCSVLLGIVRQKCESSRDLIQMSNIASYGLCVWDLARMCNRFLEPAALECIKERKKIGKTVNFIIADYIEEFGGGDYPVIGQVVDKINKINIEMFGKRDS